VWAVAVLTAAAVVVGQPLQRGPGALPVAPAAGAVAAGLGAQQPLRPDPVGRGPLPLGCWRLAVIGPPTATRVTAAVRGVAGAAGRSSRATLSPPCFVGGGWSRP
jgi:hypothetical protein